MSNLFNFFLNNIKFSNKTIKYYTFESIMYTKNIYEKTAAS